MDTTQTALVKIKFCMGCGQPTTGSIGAAGYYWSRLCQTCKDEADGTLNRQLEAQTVAMKFIGDALFPAPFVSQATN